MKEDKMRWLKRRYHRRIEEGVCPSCGRARDVMGMVTSTRYCPLCREKINDHGKLKRILDST